MAKQKYDFDLIVLGSGAGGSVAAHIVARAGKRVAIVEGESFGGESSNYGCVPTKALLHAANIYDAAKHGAAYGIRSAAVGYNYPSVKAWKDLAIKRTGAEDGKRYHESDGITVLEGFAHFINEHEITLNRRHYSSENFLIATGASWHVPDIDGITKTGYLTAKTALDVIRPPKSLFIIGAGAIGCEFAELFSIFGTKVYLADITPRILPKEDSEVSAVIEDVFETKRGMHILTSSKVLRVSKEGIMKRVTFQRGGHEHSIKVDEIMVASGKLPSTDIGLENAGISYTKRGVDVSDFMQTTTSNIYAAGDVVGGLMYVHTATQQSRIVAHNILHRDRVAMDYRAIPRITFVSPEVASVGVNEEDAQRQDLRIQKAIAPITIIGRSNVSDARDGFVKVITNKNGQLIGATVVCPNAGEVIHELTLAVQYGMHARDVASTIHAFPSWSEAVRVACSKI